MANKTTVAGWKQEVRERSANIDPLLKQAEEALTNFSKAHKLIEDIRAKIDRWNEVSQFTIKGVGNLSRGDLATLELYALGVVTSGGHGYGNLMEPLGGVLAVLKKYGIVEDGVKQ